MFGFHFRRFWLFLSVSSLVTYLMALPTSGVLSSLCKCDKLAFALAPPVPPAPPAFPFTILPPTGWLANFCISCIWTRSICSTEVGGGCDSILCWFTLESWLIVCAGTLAASCSFSSEFATSVTYLHFSWYDAELMIGGMCGGEKSRQWSSGIGWMVQKSFCFRGVTQK